LDSQKILFTNEVVVSIMSVLAVVSFVIISVSIIRQLKKLNSDDL
jgi:hypothetical protein